MPSKPSEKPLRRPLERFRRRIQERYREECKTTGRNAWPSEDASETSDRDRSSGKPGLAAFEGAGQNADERDPMIAAWDWHMPRETEADERTLLDFACDTGFDTLILPDPTSQLVAHAHEHGMRVVGIVYPYFDGGG